MDRTAIVLTDELISGYLSKALNSLMPPQGGNSKKLSIIRGQSAKAQSYAMYSAVDKENGVLFFFNAVFATSVMKSTFDAKVNVPSCDEPFVVHVMAERLLMWLKQNELFVVPPQKGGGAEYYYCSDGENEIVLGLHRDILNRILTQKLGLNTKEKIDNNSLINKAKNTTLTLDLVLPGISVSCDEILSLKIGERIKTKRKVSEGLVLSFDDKVISKNTFVSFQNGEANLIIGSIEHGR